MQTGINDTHVLELGRLLWQQNRTGECFGLVDVEVRAAGAYDPSTGNFHGAEISMDGRVLRGTVVFGQVGETVPADAVLHLVASPCAGIYSDSGAHVGQLSITPAPALLERYSGMRNGLGGCAGWIAQADPVRRVHLLDRLFWERFDRKCCEMDSFRREGDGDWNYALYVGLLAAVGGSEYKRAYTELARRVPYTAVAHEKDSVRSIESMLIGGAGLLQSRKDDGYIVLLKGDFDYFCKKYDISPMNQGVWVQQARGGSIVSPVLRLAQIAGFLSTRDFIFDNVRSVRKPEDIYHLFRTEISDYWAEYFSSSRAGISAVKMGTQKMDLLGINLVVPLMLAYAAFTRDEALTEAAVELIRKIAPEENRKTKAWTAAGVRLENAADSQAILELNNEYCGRGLCFLCPICHKKLEK